MLDMNVVWSSAKRGAFRAAMSAVLALWCVFALASGDARAFCLDLGGTCAPSAGVPAGSCHDESPDGDRNSRCGSCVDIVVHEDASANGGRADRDLPAPAAAQSPGFTVQDSSGAGDAHAALPGSRAARSPQYPLQRSVVLRV